MQLLTSLREHLLRAPEAIRPDPDHLQILAETGRVKSRAHGRNEMFEIPYRVQIIFLGYSGRFDQLAYWVLQWLDEHHPQHPEEAMSWEADVLNPDSADLSISIDLAEVVRVRHTEEGIVLHHSREPDLSSTPLDADEWSLYGNGEHLVDYTDGDG
ncbi:phage tail protein [Halorhodospira neutriphila]|uniref:Phage tail protein n=1 Tax=Halorhodospira neutriphila TaxID=168379 RepID=A0ABS1E3J0_9GAMM|nr:phage tail protein [Halorhodospira neutriphila]MBK1725712.1 hypothetical protein [Halorhodospira neutriphila]